VEEHSPILMSTGNFVAEVRRYVIRIVINGLVDVSTNSSYLVLGK
jgi:hypothetical protein